MEKVKALSCQSKVKMALSSKWSLLEALVELDGRIGTLIIKTVRKKNNKKNNKGRNIYFVRNLSHKKGKISVIMEMGNRTKQIKIEFNIQYEDENISL